VVAPDGDIYITHGIDTMSQWCDNLVNTEAGSDYLHPWLGVPSTIGRKATYGNLALVKFSLQTSFEADSRVEWAKVLGVKSLRSDIMSVTTAVKLVGVAETKIVETVL
jgi:hypothetical protein